MWYVSETRGDEGCSKGLFGPKSPNWASSIASRTLFPYNDPGRLPIAPLRQPLFTQIAEGLGIRGNRPGATPQTISLG